MSQIIYGHGHWFLAGRHGLIALFVEWKMDRACDEVLSGEKHYLCIGNWSFLHCLSCTPCKGNGLCMQKNVVNLTYFNSYQM